MAITKVKLIADSVITVDNLHASHGITTTHIGEGEKLFYTDDRVSSYLTSNNYATSAGGYFYDATLSANILTFSKSDGTTDSVDLSLYLDDTNLARLVSGTLDALTGIATFTRDDSSTFTIDFSAFLADANDYVSSGSFDTTTGVLTLTRLGGGTVTVDLDGKYAEASHTHLWAHITDRPTALSAFTNDLGNYGGFLTSFTETDPVYVASSWYTTTNNSSNWNTAYGWGNHATAGYLTSFTETDPTVPSHVKSITTTNISNWDTAYGWGNHAGLYSLLGHTHDLIRHSLAAPALIDTMTSTSFRTSLFGSNTNGYAISTSRWNTTPPALSGMNSYGTLFAWSGADTHGFIATDYSTANIQVGGGYGDNVTWKATLIHSGNIGSQSVSYATSAGTATDSSKLPLTGGTLSGTLVLGSVASAGSSAILNTNGFIRVSEHVIIHNPANLSMAQGISWDSSTNGLYTYTESATGTLRATGSMRAPLFYDSDDTGYYLDPASTGLAAKVNGNIEVYARSASWAEGLRVRVPTTNTWGGIRWTRDRANNDGNWALGFKGSGDTSDDLVFWANNGGSDADKARIDKAGNLTVTTGVYSPIFYDNNNTGYYVDPASTSVLGTGLSVGTGGSPSNSRLHVRGGAILNEAGGENTYGIFKGYNNNNHYIAIRGSVGSDASVVTGAHNTTFVEHLSPADDSTGWFFKTNALSGVPLAGRISWTSSWFRGSLYGDDSVRSPIFYDSDNTGYYVDPASTSNLNGLNVGGNAVITAGNIGSQSVSYASSAGGSHGIGYDGNAISGMGPISNWDSRPGVGQAGFGINWHTGVTISGYAGYGGVRLYASGYPTHASSVLRLEASGAVYTYGGLYSDGNAVIHAGNIGSQDVSQANRLRSYTATGTPQSANSFALGIFSNYYGGGQITDVPESGYGSLYNFGGYDASTLSLQMFSTINHNSTSATRSLYFRMGNNLGFQNDWRRVLDSGGDSQVSAGTIQSNVSLRAPIFYDSNDTGYYLNPAGQTNLGGNNDFPLRVSKTGGVNTGCVFFQNITGDNSWGIVGEFRVGGGPGADRPSILFSHGFNTNTWSVGFGSGTDDNFRINIDHGHRNGGWGTTRMLMDRSGNVTFSGDVTAYSDISVKENIRPIQSSLDKVKLLNGVTYNRTDLEDKSDKIGFIAQDVLNIIPEVVKETQDGKLSVAYGNITAVLVEAIKEQQKQIEELKAIVNGLTK
jgi:hypothetical protein